MIHRIRTIDAHAAGEPLRLVVEGFPSLNGNTMMQKRERLRARHDHLRRALMFEPRGHADMYGALLTEAVAPGSDAGVLFMHNEGYSTMCGHGVIAVVTIALEHGLLTLRPGQDRIVLDSPAGSILAEPRRQPGAPGLPEPGERVGAVAFRNVPSFVLSAGVPVDLGGRQLRVDVAFGGAFYAIADSEAAGVPLQRDRLGALRQAGMAIKQAAEKAVRVEHPLEPGLQGIYGTIFTGPADGPEADLRNVTIFANAQVDRSPCGTGTCAVMAVLSAMGLLGDDQAFTHESLIGTTFRGHIIGRTMVGDREAVVPEIEGSAWITGEHTFLISADDPLKEGFRV